ncbi:MAG: hypothetical protein CMG64_05845 [Candidatus Marinimicrobia bacterium]|nr:hypothetical protein [Candidatus Neomarinimicrobiota bacterium]|tara:strand:+ start:1871 stop:3745 length:1875 start_codon:yes stop_codon:yes gene_type:complete
MVNFFKNIIVLFFIQISLSSNYIDVITTNDVHGFIDEQTANFINPHYPPTIIGGSGFIKYVNGIKEESNNQLLILDGGNFFQGHPIGIMDSGRTMIDWMNKIGYNAIVPGNYDFLFGTENLVALSQRANFDFLASNLHYSDSMDLLFEPYQIYNIKNVNVGVLGIVNANLSDIVLDVNLSGVKLTSPIESLKKWIPVMKNNDVDIIVLLTSYGVPWDREDVYNDFINSDKIEINNAIELGYYCDGVDVIVSGGISKGYPQVWYDPHSHVYTSQNYGNGTSFGHFNIQYDSYSKLFSGFGYEVTNSISQTLFLNDFKYDSDAFEWIKSKSDQAVDKVYSNNNWDSNATADKVLNVNNNSTNDWDVPSYDVNDNLDIITWNCEFFPAAGDSTIESLSEIVNDLNVDIIAFQEIKNRGWFSKLMQKIPDYDFIISQQSSFMDQAIIYKKNSFSLISRLELFAENDYYFAGRPPLMARFIHNDSQTKFSVINLHMKCCDSGLFRRKKAALQLYDYVVNQIDNNNENIIVLGDWNDDLKDADGEHCFDPYLKDDRFFFPTWDLTYITSKASYPKEPYVSFLDHIMITNSFLDNKSYTVDTVPMDQYMGSFDRYETYISDHMPIYLSFSF